MFDLRLAARMLWRDWTVFTIVTAMFFQVTKLSGYSTARRDAATESFARSV